MQRFGLLLCIFVCWGLYEMIFSAMIKTCVLSKVPESLAIEWCRDHSRSYVYKG